MRFGLADIIVYIVMDCFTTVAESLKRIFLLWRIRSHSHSEVKKKVLSVS